MLLPGFLLQGLDGEGVMHRPPPELPDPEVAPQLTGDFDLQAVKQALAESGLAESCEATCSVAVLSQNQKDILLQAATALPRWGLRAPTSILAS